MPIEIVSALAEGYASQHSSVHNGLLQLITDETNANHAQPHMLSGHVQGRLLSFISKIINPEYILEIGTFTGYSALCLAEGLAPNGKLHTIELRENDATLAQSYFNKSIYGEKIILHRGNAKEILPTLPHRWDLVFIDADKVSYIDYYETVLPRLSSRGIIIADNVLFHGEVLKQPVSGKNALAITAFNNHIKMDPRIEHVMLTIRDGLLLIKKRASNDNIP